MVRFAYWLKVGTVANLDNLESLVGERINPIILSKQNRGTIHLV